ncbi:MAG: DNA polymerase/3'-5' exonuclease PolX [Candidatus Yanofskybacteria bacterium]|nr:DNA polymerase/3'-5' exonuclease PolX [Candidatus Yanofskybacteria bacterium]
MVNNELIKILNEMAIILDIKEVAFKPRAFERAAYSIESLEESVSEIYEKGGLRALEKIPGVGRGIAEKIKEYIKTGRVKDYEKLKKEFPVDIESLRSVEGVGPKMIQKLYKKLDIKNLDQLENAAKTGKIRNVAGLGKKTEEKILKGIGFVKSFGGRLVLGFSMPVFRSILNKIKEVEGVKIVEFAGSVRRMQETVGDLDILAVSVKPSKVMDFFVSMPEVEAIHEKGSTRSSVRLKIGIDADLRVIPPESFGAALQYFTGDKYHNIKLREIATKRGYKLNEYGLYRGKKSVAGKTEKEIYEELGFELMPPEIRTNHGELDLELNKKLPDLIGYGDLRGDLQVQTDWTDGEHSIKEMAEAAKKLGLEYICITDHTKSLAMTGGSDEKKLLKQIAAIDKINREFQSFNPQAQRTEQSSYDGKFKVLKGAEVNIMKDGSLDIDDKTLAKLDVVGAAVHSNFSMSEEEMTKRIIRAMENPNVDIIFHPTGRVINRRPAYSVNIEELLKAAKRTKTVMEIDAFPDRLDLKDEYIRKGISMGIKFSIDSDAHSTQHFQYLEYGIAQARRGWATKVDIINTRSWVEMLKLLK